MKVLLVNPSLNKKRLGSYWRFTTAVPPTGLAYIGAVLERDGFDVRIYDQHALHATNEGLMDVIQRYQPRSLPQSTYSGASWLWDAAGGVPCIQ